MPLFATFILNIRKLHDGVAQLLIENNGSFVAKGSWLGLRNVLVTSDVANIRYITSTNFSSYVKGPEWRKRFDIFGEESIFNSDSDIWKQQRRIVRNFISHQNLKEHVGKIIPEIIEKQLIPILNQVCEQNSTIDLQDLFARYAFDFACLIAFGSNPNTLSMYREKEVPFLKALDDACEAIFRRVVFPEFVWKIQRWMDIGKERRLKRSWRVMDEVFANYCSMKREQLERNGDKAGLNALTYYLTGSELLGGTAPSETVMRDNTVSLVFAAGDTTSTALSWFFWLLSRNPFCENKIIEELNLHFPNNEGKEWCPLYNLDQLNKLVYLHGAVCETLRLFPPVPFEFRTPVGTDTLPSGHQVDQNTNLVISIYAMGRMASIWGVDCCEFKPERWITKDGEIKHESSHKIFAFTAGPRICPGKEIGLTLMKAIIATIIYNYKVQLLETDSVHTNLSIVLRMEHRLEATLRHKSN